MKFGSLHPLCWARVCLILLGFGAVLDAQTSLADESQVSTSSSSDQKTLLVYGMPWFVSEEVRGQRDSVRVESMDEASELLANGETEIARLLLEQLSDEFSAEDSRRSCVRPEVHGSPSIQLASNTMGEGKRF